MPGLHVGLRGVVCRPPPAVVAANVVDRDQGHKENKVPKRREGVEKGVEWDGVGFDEWAEDVKVDRLRSLRNAVRRPCFMRSRTANYVPLHASIGRTE